MIMNRYHKEKEIEGRKVYERFEKNEKDEFIPTGIYLSKEEDGEYYFIGKDRNGEDRFKFEGTGHTTFIGSVFTFGFVKDQAKGGCMTFEKISWEEFHKAVDNLHKYHEYPYRYVNFMGHEQTANKVGLPMERITVRAKPGDTILWLQYNSPRLEEGATTVPDDASFTPMKARLFDSKIKKIVHEIVQLTKTEVIL